MIDRSRIRAMLVVEEGRERKAYPDPLTGGAPWTIGVGHTGPNVFPGLTWSDQQIDATLDADIDRAVSDCEKSFAPWFDRLGDARQAVLVGMAFQMGIGRLQGFVHALSAIRDARWPQAAGELLASKWAKQTPKRASRMARQLETGEWQYRA